MQRPTLKLNYGLWGLLGLFLAPGMVQAEYQPEAPGTEVINAPIMITSKSFAWRRLQNPNPFSGEIRTRHGANPDFYWTLTPGDTEGSYEIQSLSGDGMHLAVVHDGSLPQLQAVDGTQADASQTISDQWRVQRWEDHTYTIQNIGYDLLLEQPVEDTDLTRVSMGGGDAHRWRITALYPLPDDTPNDLPSHLIGERVVLTAATDRQKHITETPGEMTFSTTIDPASQWLILPTDDGNWVRLQNTLHPDHHLYLHHEGSGLVESWGGNDDTMRWTFEDRGDGSYFIRNKLHGNKRLHQRSDGGLHGDWGSDDGFAFRITPLSDIYQGQIAVSDLPDHYEHKTIMLINQQWSWRRLHTDHGGSSAVETHAGADPHYYWQVVPSGEGDWLNLENMAQPGAFLAAHNYTYGPVKSSPSLDDHSRWIFETRGDGSYRLRNRHNLAQLLEQSSEDTAAVYTGVEDLNDLFGWVPVIVDPALDERPGAQPADLMNKDLLLQARNAPMESLHVGDGTPFMKAQWLTGALWRIESTGVGDWVFLRSVKDPNRMLGADILGSPAVQSTGVHDENMRWLMEAQADGSYRLRNKLFGTTCLKAEGQTDAVVTAPCQVDDDAFSWYFMPLDDPSLPDYSLDPHDYDDEPIILQAQVASWARPTVNAGNNQVVESVWNEDSRSFWRIEPIDQTWFYLASDDNPQNRLHVGHNGNGLLYNEPGDDHAYHFQLEPAGVGPDGSPQFFIRNRLHSQQRLYSPSEDDRVLAGWQEGPEAMYSFVRASDLPFGWQDVAPECSTTIYEGYICLYSGDNQSGRRWCGGFGLPFSPPGETDEDGKPLETYELELYVTVPDYISRYARSMEKIPCHGGVPNYNAIVNEGAYVNNSALVAGATGNIHGRIQSRVRTISLVHPDMYVICTHKDAHYSGHTRCAPARSKWMYDLTAYFKDEISSISLNWGRGTGRNVLFTHKPNSYTSALYSSDDNLSNNAIPATKGPEYVGQTYNDCIDQVFVDEGYYSGRMDDAGWF